MKLLTSQNLFLVCDLHVLIYFLQLFAYHLLNQEWLWHGFVQAPSKQVHLIFFITTEHEMVAKA